MEGGQGKGAPRAALPRVPTTEREKLTLLRSAYKQLRRERDAQSEKWAAEKHELCRRLHLQDVRVGELKEEITQLRELITNEARRRTASIGGHGTLRTTPQSPPPASDHAAGGAPTSSPRGSGGGGGGGGGGAAHAAAGEEEGLLDGFYRWMDGSSAESAARAAAAQELARRDAEITRLQLRLRDSERERGGLQQRLLQREDATDQAAEQLRAEYDVQLKDLRGKVAVANGEARELRHRTHETAAQCLSLKQRLGQKDMLIIDLELAKDAAEDQLRQMARMLETQRSELDTLLQSRQHDAELVASLQQRVDDLRAVMEGADEHGDGEGDGDGEGEGEGEGEAGAVRVLKGAVNTLFFPITRTWASLAALSTSKSPTAAAAAGSHDTPSDTAAGGDVEWLAVSSADSAVRCFLSGRAKRVLHRLRDATLDSTPTVLSNADVVLPRVHALVAVLEHVWRHKLTHDVRDFVDATAGSSVLWSYVDTITMEMAGEDVWTQPQLLNAGNVVRAIFETRPGEACPLVKALSFVTFAMREGNLAQYFEQLLDNEAGLIGQWYGDGAFLRTPSSRKMLAKELTTLSASPLHMDVDMAIDWFCAHHNDARDADAALLPSEGHADRESDSEPTDTEQGGGGAHSGDLHTQWQDEAVEQLVDMGIAPPTAAAAIQEIAEFGFAE